MQKEVHQKSVVPYYVVGLCWLIYSLMFPLYRLQDYLVITVMSVLFYIIAKKVFPGKTVLVPVAEQIRPTGNAQADQMIAEGKQVLAEIRQVNDRIAGPEISAQISKIEEISVRIFQFVSENPNKANQLRKFLNYYLPTVLKLLNSYDRLSGQMVRGSNITETLQRIEEMMSTVVKAFEKQLDNLFHDEALDISTDITVLEGMLAQEGLTGQDFKDLDRTLDKTILKL